MLIKVQILHGNFKPCICKNKPTWLRRGGESCEQAHVKGVQNLQEFNYGKVYMSTRSVHNINIIGTKDQNFF